MRGGLRSAVLLLVAGAVLALGVHITAQSPAGQLRQAAYIKASNPGMGDHFACGTALDGHAGIGISISGDGNTMGGFLAGVLSTLVVVAGFWGLQRRRTVDDRE